MVNKAKSVQKKVSKLDPTSRLKATDKAVRGKLLYENRALACHGKTHGSKLVLTVEEAVRLTIDGAKYRMADLRYDLKGGRLALLKKGQAAGPKPLSERNTERWVPYHTVLGVHELFLMEAVHSRTDWTEKQKFLAIFVFRAHCKRAHLLLPGQDNDANLVRSIVTRSARLLKMADKAYEVVQNKKLSAKDKLADISEMIQSTEGCGDTWAKMLTVCIDLAYPKEKILDADCDVGLPDRRSALRELLGKVNKSQSASAKHFWKYLTEVETSMRQKFRHLPLVVKQADTKKHHMSASTLQVQLCEYRQFRHTWARNVYGLPDDATMRTEETTRFQAEDALSNDKTSVNCEFRHDGRTVKLSVNIKAFQSLKVAQRVAIMMMQMLVKSGASEKEAAKFRDELAKDYVQGKDVKDSSEAWKYCKVQLSHPSPLVAFVFHKKERARGTQRGGTTAARTWLESTAQFLFWGAEVPVLAAGNVLQAERIARLCWEMLQSGKNKDAVLKYRDELYKMAGGSSARKRKHEE
eukprot:g16693.t1